MELTKRGMDMTDDPLEPGCVTSQDAMFIEELAANTGLRLAVVYLGGHRLRRREHRNALGAVRQHRARAGAGRAPGADDGDEAGIRPDRESAHARPDGR